MKRLLNISLVVLFGKISRCSRLVEKIPYLSVNRRDSLIVLGTTIKSIPSRLLVFLMRSSRHTKQNLSVAFSPITLVILDLEFPFLGHFENRINNFSFFILILIPVLFIFSGACF